MYIPKIRGSDLSDDDISLFERVRSLDENREKWILRIIATLDFTDGFATYVEHATYDINSDYVAARFPNMEQHIPIAWRRRDTFLEFDCLSNSQTSLQLVELAIRERYCEWYFWQRCVELNLVKRANISPRLAEYVRTYVHDGMKAKGECGTLSQSDQRTWINLIANPEIKLIFDHIGEYQPVIIRATTQHDHISIIKLRERKSLIRSKKKKISNFMRGQAVGIVETISAGCTKLIAPRDVRFKRVDGLVLNDVGIPNPVEVKLFGDGSWAFCNTKQRGTSTVWRLMMTPRRSQLIAPGFRVLLLGLFAALYWQIMEFDASAGIDVINSFSMAIVGSVFLYYLKLFDVQISHSLQFRWASMLQRRGLMGAYAITLIFPILHHVLENVASWVDQFFGRFSSHLNGVIRLLRSDTTAYVVRWSIIGVLVVLLIDFLVVSLYGKPVVGKGGVKRIKYIVS